jgi:hypothetical protein
MTNQYPAQNPQPAPKKHRRWPWIVGGVVAVVIVAGIISSGRPTGPSGALTSTTTTAPVTISGPVAWATAPAVAAQTSVAEVPAQVTTDTAPAVDPQVQEATQAAQQYLDYTAFSRDGLIQQLSSSAGDGYPKSVATAAVDSLDIDYNAQAAKAAQQYLNFTSFSCSGLIQQLDSSAGDKYTAAQASYGAHQTSACK